MPGYLNSPEYQSYTGIGVGGQIFHESYDRSDNIGIKVSGAYHMKLDENSLSYFSIGASLSGLYSLYDTATIVDPDASVKLEKTFNPNLDIGLFFYGPNLYAGISSTNVLSNEQTLDSLAGYVPERRQYHLIGGYKIRCV